MEVIKFETLESKLIKIREVFVLLDSDVAQLYGVETKRINENVKKNSDKFPDESYMIELSEDEWKLLKSDLTTSVKGGKVKVPKAFTEKGLYMLATILKSPIATNATIQIIETFANIKQLSRNINSIDENQTKEEQLSLVEQSNILLEKIIDIQPTAKLQDDETEVETKIELNLGVVKVSRVVKSKKVKED